MIKINWHLMSNFDLSGMLNANARRFAALATKFIAASSSYKWTAETCIPSSTSFNTNSICNTTFWWEPNCFETEHGMVKLGMCRSLNPKFKCCRNPIFFRQVRNPTDLQTRLHWIRTYYSLHTALIHHIIHLRPSFATQKKRNAHWLAMFLKSV